MKRVSLQNNLNVLELLPKIRGGDGEKYEIDLMTLTRDWEVSNETSFEGPAYDEYILLGPKSRKSFNVSQGL